MKVFLGLFAMMTVAAAAGEYQQHYHQAQQHYQEPQQHYEQTQHHYEQPKKHIPILKSENNRNHDGSYNFNYETGNGIHAQEHGYTKNAGHKDAESQVAEGYFSYTGDDGVPVGLKYVADEHGFRAEGSHLPTPPPIPHEIQEALAKLAANPHQQYQEEGDDGQYHHYQQEQEAQYAHQPQTYNQQAAYQPRQQHQQHQQHYSKY